MTWTETSRDVSAEFNVVSRLHVQSNSGLDATVRVDGCVDLRRYYNGAPHDDAVISENDIDYIHICDLAAFIAELEALKAMALARIWEGKAP